MGVKAPALHCHVQGRAGAAWGGQFHAVSAPQTPLSTAWRPSVELIVEKPRAVSALDTERRFR
jgi:hypothetical protein